MEGKTRIGIVLQHHFLAGKADDGIGLAGVHIAHEVADDVGCVERIVAGGDDHRQRTVDLGHGLQHAVGKVAVRLHEDHPPLVHPCLHGGRGG